MHITVSMIVLSGVRQIESTYSNRILPCYPLYLGQPRELLPSGSPIAILKRICF